MLQLTDLRKIVLSLAINAQHAVLLSPPFGGMIARVFQDQLANIWTELQLLLRTESEPLQQSLSASKFAGNVNDSPKWLGLSIGKRASKGVEIPVTSRTTEAFPGVELFSDRNSLEDVRFASLRNGAHKVKSIDPDSIFGKRLCECSSSTGDVNITLF